MKGPDYILERHKFGYLVKSQQGSIPMDCFSEICELVGPGMLIDPGISSALEAILALGKEKDLEKWRTQIKTDLEENIHLTPAMRWLRGVDTGTSSVTIFAALIGNEQERGKAIGKIRGQPDIPHDASDFGRCVRLLDLTPAWKNQLVKVAEHFPESRWKHVVPVWGILEKLYHEDKHEELAAALRKLEEIKA